MRPTPLKRTLSALLLLTTTTVQRLLREGMVLRSMIWPAAVVVGTLAATIVIMAFLRPAREVAVPPGCDPELVEILEEAGFTIHTVPDPRAAVDEELVSVATDGRQLWARGTSTLALEVEEFARIQAGSPWRPSSRDLPDRGAGEEQGRKICRILGMLFVMYGAVFGLGSVARDRDNGTLEAELALPVPRWVGGLARWIASVGVLALFYALSVVMLDAVVGVREPGATIRHGLAAAGGGVAIGLGVVGTAGLKQGFSGPFAAALTGVTGLAAVGYLGVDWLPVASLFSDGDGYAAVAVSVGLGLLAAAVYAHRTGRS